MIKLSPKSIAKGTKGDWIFHVRSYARRTPIAIGRHLHTQAVRGREGRVFLGACNPHLFEAFQKH